MKSLSFSFLFLLSGCSMFHSSYERRSVQNERRSIPYAYVRVYHRDENWRPESNCKEIKYVKIHSERIQESEYFYSKAVERLKYKVSSLGGSAVKIYDYTNQTMYAHAYFCSAEY